MNSDIVSRFLEALKMIKPEAGRLDVLDAQPLEEELGETPTVSIYGRCDRADLERVLRGLVASENVES